MKSKKDIEKHLGRKLNKADTMALLFDDVEMAEMGFSKWRRYNLN